MAPNPDLLKRGYSGCQVATEAGSLKVRSLKTWMDLAELLDCRMLLPKDQGIWALFRYCALDPGDSPHHHCGEATEKYGSSSKFSLINKAEDPWFVATFLDALNDCRLFAGAHVLDLGCNRGDTFGLLGEICGSDFLMELRLTGIDHSTSALEIAAQRFPSHRFLLANIKDYLTWDLPTCDLLISVGTLQSPGLAGKNLFPGLFKKLVAPGGAVILGFPNVRYFDGELSYGARMKNYRQPELSLLVKDLFHYRRYLQQRGYRVKLHGKYDIFLVAEKPA